MAFDGINWIILRYRMIDALYLFSIINTMEQLNGKAHAHTTPVLFTNRIKILRGVLSGGILSRTLLNLYYDDLINHLNRNHVVKPFTNANNLSALIKGQN